MEAAAVILVVICFVAFCLLCLGGFAILGVGWFFRKLNDHWADWSWTKRFGFCGTGILVIALPYLTYKAWEYSVVFARVPEPLQSSWIEYRVEEAWGIGLPGDAETGIVVFRLTSSSAAWARAKAADLGHFLPGGSQEWQPTPVDDRPDGGKRWHLHDGRGPPPPHGPDIKEYLDKFGFSIPVDRRRIDEVNRAIRTPGSFYSYGRGGRVTIVDPQSGKVYFAYAG